MKRLAFLLFLLLLFVFPQGCGNQSQPLVATFPLAGAGADQSVFVNLQSQLDGSASTGNQATYFWRALTYPAGSTSPTITSEN